MTFHCWKNRESDRAAGPLRAVCTGRAPFEVLNEGE
jgi:hypothetical protein